MLASALPLPVLDALGSAAGAAMPRLGSAIVATVPELARRGPAAVWGRERAAGATPAAGSEASLRRVWPVRGVAVLSA